MERIKITNEYSVKVSNLVRSGKVNASLVDSSNKPICGRTFDADVTQDAIIDWAVAKITATTPVILCCFISGAAFDYAHDIELKRYLDRLDDEDEEECDEDECDIDDEDDDE